MDRVREAGRDFVAQPIATLPQLTSSCCFEGPCSSAEAPPGNGHTSGFFRTDVTFHKSSREGVSFHTVLVSELPASGEGYV